MEEFFDHIQGDHIVITVPEGEINRQLGHSMREIVKVFLRSRFIQVDGITHIQVVNQPKEGTTTIRLWGREE